MTFNQLRVSLELLGFTHIHTDTVNVSIQRYAFKNKNMTLFLLSENYKNISSNIGYAASNNKIGHPTGSRIKKVFKNYDQVIDLIKQEETKNETT